MSYIWAMTTHERGDKVLQPGYPEGAEDPAGFFGTEEWTRAASDPITWQDVQRILAHVPGSLSDTVIEQRDEQ